MPERWTAERAWEWADNLPILAGCNYVPASAINQIEMWAAATWYPDRIDAEFRAASAVGFNAMRVYLHDRVWRAEGEAFLDRIDSYLAIADRHGIRTLFVFFDDCWHEPGPVPEPVPGLHNSGWARSPGHSILMDRSQWGELKSYVRAVVRRFRDDPRVLGWDLYNEVGNYAMTLGLVDSDRDSYLTRQEGHDEQRRASLDLATACADWVRAEDPVQPVTVGSYQGSDRMGVDAVIQPLCDVHSFHHYGSRDDLLLTIEKLETLGRPLLCTEYLNRLEGCTFASHLTELAARRIPAFNWGLVDGKTQTKFSWTDRPQAPGKLAEPDPWFHEVLRADLSPYDPAETELIRELLG